MDQREMLNNFNYWSSVIKTVGNHFLWYIFANTLCTYIYTYVYTMLPTL